MNELSFKQNSLHVKVLKNSSFLSVHSVQIFNFSARAPITFVVYLVGKKCNNNVWNMCNSKPNPTSLSQRFENVENQLVSPGPENKQNQKIKREELPSGQSLDKLNLKEFVDFTSRHPSESEIISFETTMGPKTKTKIFSFQKILMDFLLISKTVSTNMHIISLYIKNKLLIIGR